MLQLAFDGTRSICHACWHAIDTAINHPPVPPPPPAPQRGLEAISVPGITRAANTARQCLFDTCNSTELRQVPNTVKVHLLSYYHCLIPRHARICQDHLVHTPVEDIPPNVQAQHTLTSENILDIISMYTLAMERKAFFNVEDTNEISEEDLQFWTGLRRENFESMLSEIPSIGQQSTTPKTDLAVYLCKLRTGEPNNRIGTIFNVSRRSVDRKIRKVRNCIAADFVPFNLGLDHITRDQVIHHNRILPNNIFGNEAVPKAIVIFDGTYLFVEKSSNFLFQRRSYSLHKYRNLVKPFLIVCADGYIIDVTGPYPAVTSDSDIMEKILQNHDEPIEDGAFHYFFESGDIFILDRGFRDSISLIESHGYVAHMPPSKSPNETQLSTESANKSRLITMCRWIVETINGRFKRDFKIFRHRVFNLHVPFIFTDFRIAAAIINRFQEPYSDSVYVQHYINLISENVNRPNLLADYVIAHNLNRQRATFSRLVADSPEVSDFPRLTQEDLILFGIGTYHVKLARSYASEHIKGTGVYEIDVYREPQNVNINNEENNILIRCRIQSRHVQRKIYYTYVMYNVEAEGRAAIKQYYCSCIHGKRTLGSCAHVMSVVYYLGWARHQQIFTHPSYRLNDILIDLENE